ncbi:MAG: hypothetical protein A2V98_03215 [Planctomycetes bacterium RBG_16_64_12]|nr:MAG: hypothetical protein A2V98_03215 [Planctomycetes bacterium RBG_16_64_12]
MNSSFLGTAMLRWRIAFGVLIVAALAALCWLDDWLHRVTEVPGIALFPVLVVVVVLASREVLHLTAAGGMRPVPWVVYCGSLLVVTSCWVAPVFVKFDDKLPQDSRYLALISSAAASDWTLVALAVGVLMAFAAEMYRFKRPGGVTINVAAAVFGITYVGFLLSFLVKLHLVWGLRALVSTLIVVKMGDVGAYAVGRLIGRSKMAPGLSPGKTIEGALGAMAFACLGSWATLHWLPTFHQLHWLFQATSSEGARAGTSWGWILFGLLVGISGMVGDLAESLIKRDVQQKDSSDWVPGFGGVLDILDSALLAAPAACACWAFRLVT